MKKITIPLLCLLFFTSSAHSQTTLACQFTASNGHTYEGDAWKRTGFILAKPFFIKMNPDGIIDGSSLTGVEMHYNPQCKKLFRNIQPERVVCLDGPDTLVLNTKTLEGAISRIGGATQPINTKRDDLVLKIFNCQPM